MLDLLAGLFGKKMIQSCYVEPAKSDVPAANFTNFMFNKYQKQMQSFVNNHDKELEIPDGWVWTPDNIDEGCSNDKYMQMPVILLAIMCLHAKYASSLNFNVFDRIISVMCWQMYRIYINSDDYDYSDESDTPDDSDDSDDSDDLDEIDFEEQDIDVEIKPRKAVKSKIIHTKPVTARLIKYIQYNNGAGNAGKITVGDYGHTKPYWKNPATGEMSRYNQYARLRGVELCFATYIVFVFRKHIELVR